MKKLAVFYHCRLSNVDPPILFDHAAGIMDSQMRALRESGLEAAASEIYVGVNGDEADTFAAQLMAPEKARVVCHGSASKGEQPTLHALQAWLPAHPDWAVLYFHTKGAMHTDQPTYDAWRECMMRTVVWNWQMCVRDLEQGFELVGNHWITPRNCQIAPVPYYFAGNFWWATAKFLLTLPPIAPTAVQLLNRFDAEVWVARGPRPAHAMDHAAHWPGVICQSAIA